MGVLDLAGLRVRFDFPADGGGGGGCSDVAVLTGSVRSSLPDGAEAIGADCFDGFYDRCT